MIDITDKSYQPTPDELGEYIGNPLFERLRADVQEACQALLSVEYSGDKQLLGWNLRFRKGGRSLCRLYPRPGYFTLLVVIGRKEKERAEALLPSLCPAMQAVYAAALAGMGLRWLLIDLHAAGDLYEDVLKLIRLRRFGTK